MGTSEAVTLEEWVSAHQISCAIRQDVIVVPRFGRGLIMRKYDSIFRESKKDGGTVFNTPENVSYLLADDIGYIVFPFGERWFYVEVSESGVGDQFKVFRHVGETPVCEHQCPYYPLGIHTGYELLNGSGMLSDWCAKAKWLGYEGLGVADRNTMASSLDLQRCATAAGLRYCFGYSLTVRTGMETVGVKVYAQTQEGFRNMLRIQKGVAVDNWETKELDMVSLLNRAAGNALVFDKWSGDWLVRNGGKLDDFVRAFGGRVYFQVDTTEYRADRIDSQVLESMKAYFDAFSLGGGEYRKNVRPVLIQDVYYLDREDWRNKMVLNKIDVGAAHEQSRMQYMKTVDELYGEFRALFSDKYGDDVFYGMCRSTVDIAGCADAAYDLTDNYAPKYDMTLEERGKYGDTLTMFRQLVEDGFRKLVPDGEEEKYRERVEYEKYVIESTDNVDYILIQRDELNWAQENGILTGIGRGSAGGCLLLYLLGITFIDPLRYGLLFERFLLPERAGLAPMDVTKMAGGILSEEYVEIELDDGRTVRFDKDAVFLVERGGERVSVYADELEGGDEIIWDRRDELFTLGELEDISKNEKI